MTTRLARAMVRDARHLSITEIARRIWVVVVHGHDARTRSARLQAHRRTRPCLILLVDANSFTPPDEDEAARRVKSFVYASAETEIPEFRSVVVALARIWLSRPCTALWPCPAR